jgi:hypothetical protein
MPHHPTPHTRTPPPLQVASFRAFAGVPNIVAAIDGSEIPIITPPFTGDAYRNRKGDTSVKLQAACDATMKFLDVYTGITGRWHDQHAFHDSPLYGALHGGWLGQKLEEAHVVVQLPAAAGAAPVRARLPLQLIADSAYACTKHVLPAFFDSTARTGSRLVYNQKHASTRNVIERAFGLLKARWRVLRRASELKLDNTVLMIVASCTIFALRGGCWWSLMCSSRRRSWLRRPLRAALLHRRRALTPTMASRTTASGFAIA